MNDKNLAIDGGVLFKNRRVSLFELRYVHVHSGFSLIEVLIAVLLLGVGLFAMAAVPVMTTKLTAQSLHREQALLLALTKLEELEAVGTVSPVNEQPDPRNRRYALSWSKSGESGDTAAVLRVTVFWQDMRGIRQELTVERAVSPFAAETVRDDK